ncbi:phytanoyl-CoA dioxygenase domain-containing protein 1 homolog [Argopecten irradians]|uniref:phytanoyl-CoA dioxygenase domain-containing protein 1 homolog n=1 Tax=Argopecten irradians TaxID=31199 RepID=UPI0037245A4E
MTNVQVGHPPIEYGLVADGHPELFDIRAMPSPHKDKKPGQLSNDMIRQFFENGYVIVKDFFSSSELDPCRAAVENQVERLARKLFKAGKIKDLYNKYGLFERLTYIERDFPGANIILHKYPELSEAFKNLWTNERLLNVIEQLIGPEIAGHPLWNLRTKTPQNEATTVPWHQDSAYLDNKSYKVLQPTAWIPLLDTTAHNGCMQVVHGGHRAGKVATHQCCHGGTWYVMVDEEEMEKSLGMKPETDIVTCEVPYGGMLLLNNMIPHRSLPNMSGDIRWSLDLRWQNPDQPFGFYDLKQGVLMRTAKDPNFKMSWEVFDSLVRYTLLREATVEDQDQQEEEFNTTIQGPWMKKWEIVHMNRHVESYRDNRVADKS